MSVVTYRRAALNDLPGVHDMENLCFSPYDRFSKKNLKHMITSSKTAIVDMITYSNQLVGYAIYLTRSNSNKVRLYSICIHPMYSGQGIAKEYLLLRLKDLSSKFEAISLEVRESNSKALSLYQGLDFQIKKVLPQYYADLENGLKLEKRLP